MGRKKQKFSKIINLEDGMLGMLAFRDVLSSSSSPRATTEVVNGNKRLPHIATDLGKGEERVLVAVVGMVPQHR
jgi:hypothetical protein